MSRKPYARDGRRQQAESAWSELPHGGHDAVALRVQCANSHHVAIVYRTGLGPVFASQVRGRSHGSRDRIDEPRGPRPVDRWFDLLEVGQDPQVDDAMPAWCDCGPRTLSRAALLEWMTSGERRVVVN